MHSLVNTTILYCDDQLAERLLLNYCSHSEEMIRNMIDMLIWEKEMTTHPSILVENSMDRGPRQATEDPHGVTKSQTQLID